MPFSMFRFSDLAEFDPIVRSFILIGVAVAYPAWDVGFELGAFGRIFFEKLFMVWAISTALLISLLILPNKKRKVPYVAFAVTAFPSVWLILAMLARTSPDSADLRLFLFLTGLVSYLACFPYALYMAISVAYPELLSAKRPRPKVTLLSIIVLLFVAGYAIGRHHPRFITCEDFAFSGQHVPENCQPETALEPIFR